MSRKPTRQILFDAADLIEERGWRRPAVGGGAGVSFERPRPGEVVGETGDWGSAAIFSADYHHRYFLFRRTDSQTEQVASAVTWIMLNPSRADALKDDPTIKRVLNFSRRWGYSRVWVVNLYSLRSPHPRDIVRAGDEATPRAGWSTKSTGSSTPRHTARRSTF